MAIKKIKINYFYPIVKTTDEREVISNLTSLMEGLNMLAPEERIIKDGYDGNIQLKKMNYDSDKKRWYLCFLKNRTEAPFITKLEDNSDTAEPLDDNEFIGQECCLIYDEDSRIISLQNNRNSISFGGVNSFFNNFAEKSFRLSAIVYEDKYCEISDEDGVEYKSIILGYTEITKLKELSIMSDDKAIRALTELASDLSAINGKIELNVGRTKEVLFKEKLKKLVEFFNKNREVTKNLKVKMVDHDNIRLIDLLNNKVNDDINISISKEDPKTFNKILDAMDVKFDFALGETFDKCKTFVKI